MWTCKWPEEEGEGRRGLPQAQVTKGLGQAWGARCLPGQEKDFLRWKLTSCSGDPLEGLMPFSFFKPGRGCSAGWLELGGQERRRAPCYAGGGPAGPNGAGGTGRFIIHLNEGLCKPAMPRGFGRKLLAILLTGVPSCAGANGPFPPGGVYGPLCCAVTECF